MFILGIFLGDGFSKSWHNFLLGVHILGRVGGIFFGIFGGFSIRGVSSSLWVIMVGFFLGNFRGMGGAGSSVPPA